MLCATVRAGTAAFSWPDVEGRIQYAWFTEDARALDRLEEQFAGAAGSERLQDYYGALLAWRAGELAAPTDSPGKPLGAAERARAREWAGRCIARLERVLRADADFAEGHALQSACLTLLGRVEGWRVSFAGSRANAQIEAALRLAPHNPRVLLCAALGERERTGTQPADRTRRAAALRRAVDAFERERTEEAEHVPAWGAADAWLELARAQLERGDALGARDALEHTLLLAPDYLQARRLMQRIVVG